MHFALVVLWAGAAPPPPDEPVPRDRLQRAARLAMTTRDLHEAIDRWRATTDPFIARAKERGRGSRCRAG
jgi:hypothetical protein